MMWGYGYVTPGMTAWMIVSSVIWLALVSVAVWALVSWLRSRTPDSVGTASTHDAGPSAQEILRRRYARGEIDEQTFVRVRDQLDASSASTERREALTSGGRG